MIYLGSRIDGFLRIPKGLDSPGQVTFLDEISLRGAVENTGGTRGSLAVEPMKRKQLILKLDEDEYIRWPCCIASFEVVEMSGTQSWMCFFYLI